MVLPQKPCISGTFYWVFHLQQWSHCLGVGEAFMKTEVSSFHSWSGPCCLGFDHLPQIKISAESPRVHVWLAALRLTQVCVGQGSGWLCVYTGLLIRWGAGSRHGMLWAEPPPCAVAHKGLHFVTTNCIMTCYISKCIFTSGKIKPINKQPWFGRGGEERRRRGKEKKNKALVCRSSS